MKEINKIEITDINIPFTTLLKLMFQLLGAYLLIFFPLTLLLISLID